MVIDPRHENMDAFLGYVLDDYAPEAKFGDILFLDTEFTGLDQDKPDLISIALVDTAAVASGARCAFWNAEADTRHRRQRTTSPIALNIKEDVRLIDFSIEDALCVTFTCDASGRVSKIDLEDTHGPTGAKRH